MSVGINLLESEKRVLSRYGSPIERHQIYHNAKNRLICQHDLSPEKLLRDNRERGITKPHESIISIKSHFAKPVAHTLKIIAH